MKRVAAQQPPQAQIPAPDRAVAIYGLTGIGGAGRVITAVATEKRADKPGVSLDERYQRPFHLIIDSQCFSRERVSPWLSASAARRCETTTMSWPASFFRFLRKLSLINRLILFRLAAVRTFRFETAIPSLARPRLFTAAITRN